MSEDTHAEDNPGPSHEYDGLSDHALLAGGVHDLVVENAAAASRLQRMLEFYQRRCAEVDPAAVPGRRALTPVQETVIEVGELWGLSPGRVRSDLLRGRVLTTSFPDVWRLCRSGALDGYRAGLVADAATNLPERSWPAFADRVGPWLRKQLRRPGDDPDLPEIVCCTVKQLRNKLTYEVNKLAPREADERFRRSFAERRASARMRPADGSVDDGMGSLSVTHSIDQVQLADYRLTLSAKALRAAGDERTLEQLRADLAMDLLTGRAEIQSPTAELERRADGEPLAPDAGAASAGAAGPGPDPVVSGWITRLPALGFARPVINLTVPMQTLMGVCDDPGVLSGGTVVPATLARLIAQQPGSTWHRMLTDPAGGCVEVSTTSYRPTASIWNDVVARWSTCFRPGCDRAAAESELDHRVPWPAGATSNTNLQPACGRDHTAKHTPGFGVGTEPGSGDTTLRTRAGFRHPVRPADQPVGSNRLPDDLFEFQHTATELHDALTHLTDIRRSLAAGPLPIVEELLGGVA